MDTPNSDNYTLGKGTVAFNRKVSGSYTGYRDLGNAPSLTMNVDISNLDHYSSRSGLRSKDKTVVQEVTPVLNFGLDEITDKNFAMSLLGLETSSSQTAEACVSTSVTVGSTLDIYTQLDHKKLVGVSYIKYNAETSPIATSGTLTGGTSGATATIENAYAATDSGLIVLSNITGTFETGETLTDDVVGEVTSDGVVIEQDADDILVMDTSAALVLYTAGTDYRVKVTSGDIMYLSSGNISESDELTVAYAVEAATYSTINMLQETEILGKFKFVSDNATGANYELELWSVSLVPDGDMALIGEDWMNLNFTGEMLKDEAGHPAQPYGRMIIDVT